MPPEKDEKSDAMEAAPTSLNLPVAVRDLAVVAIELKQCAREVNANIERFEKSHSMTQEILDLEFTV